MSLPRLIAALTAAGSLLAGGGARATNPHLDPGRVPGGCRACHEGHGAPGSPMLAAPQNEVCLACHDSRARADEQVRLGRLAPGADPPLLGATLSMPSTHPLTETAYSRHEPGAVTCSSCHSPHRRSTDPSRGARAPGPKISTRSPVRFEFELCESCHGSQGPATRSLLDSSRSFDPNNRSYHPVRAPSAERSPSLREGLAGSEISCTDCHDSSRADGPRGPHGSLYSPLLALGYRSSDGSPESSETYALCYSCHVRNRVLDGSPFPLHRLHVVDQGASCATCHAAHGSIENRALIRFGEESTTGGVQPSLSTGRLAYESGTPGSGLCSLTCHGIDHAPLGYGPDALLSEALRRSSVPASSRPPGATEPEPPAGRPSSPRPTRRRPDDPPGD